MLRLLKNSTFLVAIHCASDIIKTVRTIFQTSDAQLFDALCDVNTEGKNDVRQKYLIGSGEKISFDPEHRN